MKRIRNDTYFDVVDGEELFRLGKRVIQAESIGTDRFLTEVMYEKV